MFDVVADVERYPEFLPGWHEVRILRRQGLDLLVEQRLGLAGLTRTMRSLARLQRPESIVVRPVDGLTEGLSLEWRFTDRAAGGCDVSLMVRGQSSSRLLELALDVAAHQAGRELVDRFAARAAAMDQSPCKPEPRT